MALSNQFDEISRYIRENAEQLLRDLTRRVRRSGLAQGADASDKANELLSEMTIEALQNAERYNSDKPLPNWLAGITKHLILRQKTSYAKRQRREPLATDLAQKDYLSEEEIFDLLAVNDIFSDTMENDIANKEVIRKAFYKLSKNEQKVVMCAILLGMDSDEVAKELGIKPGAARVRLYRATLRLHDYYKKLLDGE
jgi:RNA polymerase sigma factor (sigma-70 family)